MNYGREMKIWGPMPPVFYAREQIYKDLKGWEWEYSKKKILIYLATLGSLLNEQSF